VIVGIGSTLLGVAAILVIGVGALYGLHRLALRLEEGGYLYYRNKQSSGGGAGCFVALQRIIEPRTEHVLLARDSSARNDEGGSAGGPSPIKQGNVRSADSNLDPG
jgi:hypothetical protein